MAGTTPRISAPPLRNPFDLKRTFNAIHKHRTRLLNLRG